MQFPFSFRFAALHVLRPACMLGSTLATLAAAQSAPAADNPAGTWLLDDGHYKVQVLPQVGDRWRAKIVALGPGVATKDVENPNASLRTRDIVGTDLFWNLRWNPREHKCTDGTLYAPEHGKTITATAWLEGPNTLRVQGRVLMITHTRTLKRVAN
ncbi:DUF2147 domain-containing protein [Hymenobacter sp. BT664]|uniref:DUF2147 domain-containing protein n=1 Tax=Hymenobacter montanus TaxID=2771359 RepID=A0A927BBU3_9BACT|nr:DUF2147 domain-containing protein [Hymenobacter montanus]MBD2767871.1 DUF2147 domain-containing protein [Hymenobacter montanus]